MHTANACPFVPADSRSRELVALGYAPRSSCRGARLLPVLAAESSEGTSDPTIDWSCKFEDEMRAPSPARTAVRAAPTAHMCRSGLNFFCLHSSLRGHRTLVSETVANLS